MSLPYHCPTGGSPQANQECIHDLERLADSNAELLAVEGGGGRFFFPKTFRQISWDERRDRVMPAWSFLGLEPWPSNEFKVIVWDGYFVLGTRQRDAKLPVRRWFFSCSLLFRLEEHKLPTLSLHGRHGWRFHLIEVCSCWRAARAEDAWKERLSPQWVWIQQKSQTSCNCV